MIPLVLGLNSISTLGATGRRNSSWAVVFRRRAVVSGVEPEVSPKDLNRAPRSPNVWRLAGILALVFVISASGLWTAGWLVNHNSGRRIVESKQTATHAEGGNGDQQKMMNRFHCMFTAFQRDGNHVPIPIRRAPIGGKALYSWRAEMSGYFFNWDVSWDRSQSWDSPSNRGLVWRSSCFSADEISVRAKYQSSETGEKLFPETNVMAIIGPGTPFGDGDTPPLPLAGLPPGESCSLNREHRVFPGRHLVISIFATCRRR